MPGTRKRRMPKRKAKKQGKTNAGAVPLFTSLSARKGFGLPRRFCRNYLETCRRQAIRPAVRAARAAAVRNMGNIEDLPFI